MSGPRGLLALVATGLLSVPVGLGIESAAPRALPALGLWLVAVLAIDVCASRADREHGWRWWRKRG